MTRFFLFLSIAFFGFITPFFSVQAVAGQGGLSVTPMFRDIAIGEDEAQKDFTVSVRNDTEVLVTLRLSMLDFGSLDESGGVAFLGAQSDLEKKYALASWMRPEKDAIALLPGETQDVRITIENRESLSPGGHYAAILFKAGDDTGVPDQANRVALNQLFSVLVFAKKVGGEVYRLNLNDYEYVQRFWMLPRTVRLRFQNGGNVHVVPRGLVTVTDPLGRTVHKGIVNEESSLVLPETLRTIVASMKSVALSVVPGRYVLTIASRYDGRENFDMVSETFWYFPPLTMLGIVLFFALAFAWRRWMKKKMA